MERYHNICGLGNYYGGLCIKKQNGVCYWAIENYDGIAWEQIPESLYNELKNVAESYYLDE